MRRSAGETKTSWEQIAASVTESILARRLAPGTRIGEEELAAVFHVSRTVVRRALGQLASQGIVAVRPKKGWFVVEPTESEVADVFATRRVVEGGLIREFMRIATPEHLRDLWAHIEAQRQAIADDDISRRSRLLNDFDVAMAQGTGNQLLTRIVADLTMRTVLVSMLYQTTQEASASADEHARILQAIEAHDDREAVRLLEEHLRHVEAGLQERRSLDPVGQLRKTLAWRPESAALAR
jgi:DNA-binding GntR family transcriptional regulator